MNVPRPATLLGAIAGLLVLATVSSAAAQQRPLIDIYKKEYSILESEKKTLEGRRNELQASSDQTVRRARADVEALQRRVLEVRERASVLESELGAASGGGATIDPAEQREALVQTLGRARETLQAEGAPSPVLPDDASDDQLAAHVKTTFDHGADAIERAGAASVAPGTFFLPDGRQVEGTILSLGKIAHYGVSPEGSGALAPAGDGRLRLWESDDASATATALVDGESPERVGVFLHETLEKAVEPPKEKSLGQIMDAGGLIGWVIVALGALAALLMLLRGATLLLAATPTRRMVPELVELLHAGRTDAALERARRFRGVAARVAEATLPALGRSNEQLENVVSAAILHQTPALMRFGSALTVFAAVAPLLGLLGTVTGMISTFDLITEYGTGDPQMLSGGISEALVTTELGLLVAIPTLLVGAVLNARANGLIDGMEQTALQLVNASAHRVPTELVDVTATATSATPAPRRPTRAAETASADAEDFGPSPTLSGI